MWFLPFFLLRYHEPIKQYFTTFAMKYHILCIANKKLTLCENSQNIGIKK